MRENFPDIPVEVDFDILVVKIRESFPDMPVEADFDIFSGEQSNSLPLGLPPFYLPVVGSYSLSSQCLLRPLLGCRARRPSSIHWLLMPPVD
jgi:hypothetical protein